MSFCQLGDQCVVFDRASQLPGLSYTNAICQGCRDDTRSTLNLLRYDYVDLSQLIPKADGRSDSRICRPKPESSPPIAVAVFTLRGEVAYLVGLVSIVLRQHLGATVRPRLPVREGYALDHDVRWLMEHTDELATLPSTKHYWRSSDSVLLELTGVDLIGELRALHRRARTMCGLDPRAITVPGCCPTCETASLRRTDDNADKVWCRHCRLTWTSEEYAKVVRLQIQVPRNPS